MRRRSQTGMIALCAAVLMAAAPPSNSQVADAAMRRDRETVQALVREGADVNAAQGDGMTALHWAAVNGDADMAKLLLYAGANTEAVTRHGGHTALNVAAREGRAEVVTVLLDAGANANTSSSSGVTPLHHAALGGSAEATRALLARGAAVDPRESMWNQTPLVFATAWNRLEVVRVLLDAGADPNVYTRVNDLAAQRNVDAAAQTARSRVLATFREQEGDPISWRPTAGQVQAAVRAAHQVQMTMLNAAEAQDPVGDEGVGGGGATQGGLTPLLHAAREGHIDVAMALLDAGADIDQRKLVDGYTPLLMAVINGHYDLGLALLDRGADPNLVATLDGVSPLWGVISNFWGAKTRYPQPQDQHYQKASYLETMEALLLAGADPNHRITTAPFYLQYTFGSLGVNFSGATAFFRAAHTVDVEAMRLLVKHGADHTLTTLVATTVAGRGRGAGPGAAAGAGAAPAPAETPAVPVGTLQPGVHPIHAAAGVSYGVSFTANFHLHAPDGWMPAIQYLVEELGHDVNIRDSSGYTPLHHAASRGDNDMILYLVEKGADVMAVASNGRTTVDMANGPGQRITPYPSTIALLESMGAINNHQCVSC